MSGIAGAVRGTVAVLRDAAPFALGRAALADRLADARWCVVALSFAAPLAEAPGTEPQQLLHGCEVPRLLPDHHRVLACVHRCVLRRLLHRAVPAHGRKGTPHRGMQLQAQGRVNRGREEAPHPRFVGRPPRNPSPSPSATVAELVLVPSPFTFTLLPSLLRT